MPRELTGTSRHCLKSKEEDVIEKEHKIIHKNKLDTITVINTVDLPRTS